MSLPANHKEFVAEFCAPESLAPFSIAEYRLRLEKIRKAMAEAKIDLLYLTMPENIFYVSGYQAIWFQTQMLQQWEPVSGVAIHVDSDSYIHFEADREEVLCKLTTVSTDLRIWNIRSEQPFGDFIVENLKQAGWLAGTVGLELSHYRPNPAASARFRAKFEDAGCRVVDGADIVTKRIRHIKSPQERAYTRTAARICDIGMQAAIDTIRPGVSELDVYAEIIYAMSKAGGENPSLTLPVQSGPKTAAPHAMPSRRKIMPGDVVGIDVCGVYNRYHADNARTFSIGEPDPDVAKLCAANAKAMVVLAKAIRPNVPVNEVTAPLRAYYKETGLWGHQRWMGGYELGVAFPPDWVGPWSYDCEFDSGDEIFETGVVVNYESNIYFPQGPGMTLLIDTLLFDDDKAELIHKIPHDLIVID
ncbi:MAG: Xaa-Pro peptidase family protein [Alphaproteobacteria bacterium]